MADIRFKVNGSAPPFIANVCVDGTTTVVASEVIEYSSTSSVPYSSDVHDHRCAIIGGLNQNTTYCVNVIDSVGNATGFTTTTPQTPVEPLTLLNTNLGGTISSPTPCVKTLTGSKCLQFSPALSGNQCVDVTLFGISQYTSGDYSNIIVYKRCTSSGSFNEIINLENNTTNCQTNIKPGDAICYEMTSVLNYSENQECFSNSVSELYLSCVEPVNGFGSNCCLTCGPQTDICMRQCCCVTTTTTTSTIPAIKVYFGNLQCTNDNLKYADLCTNPPLQSDQTLRVCFYMQNTYAYNEILSSQVSLLASQQSGCFVQNFIATQTTNCTPPQTCSESDNFYIDVTCSNINNLCFILSANECTTNPNTGLDYCAYTCMAICGISNMVNGNFSYLGQLPTGGFNKFAASLYQGTFN